MTENRIQCTMPIKQDEAAEKNQGVSYQPINLFKPLPDVPGTTHTNEVFIPLFTPSSWSMFNPTEEQAQRIGMSTVNPFKHPGDNELYTFYFKVATHTVPNYVRPDGSVGFATVVCPVKLNYYLEKHVSYKPLFINPRCPFCEAAGEAWNEHNDRWMALGIDKKNLSKEGYRTTIQNDPVLLETRERAYSFKVVDRIVMNVFDYAKFTGNRALSDGETLGYQTWFTPKKVLDALVAVKDSADSHNTPAFYDFYSPNGLQLVNVAKNTERCTPGNFRDTTYSCFPGVHVNFDDNWKVYLTNLANMPDPSGAFVILPYEEASVYAQKAVEPKTSYNQVPAQYNPQTDAKPVPPQAPAPQAPPASAQAPQTAPEPAVAPYPSAPNAVSSTPAPKAPVVAPPPQMAPAAPVVAPPPQMAPAAPVVATPPQMAPATPTPPAPNAVPAAPAPAPAPAPVQAAQAPQQPAAPAPTIPAVSEVPDRDEDSSDEYPDGIQW